MGSNPTVDSFAYREVPVETLGFSPFELLYGRSVPGPLSLLKDSWLETPTASNLKSVVEFVLDMRERLRSSITHAQQHAEEQKNKLYADIFSDTPGKTFLAIHHPPNLNGPKRLNKRSSISSRA